MMPTAISTALLLHSIVVTTLLLLAPITSAALLADCSACDTSLTQPVYYGCIGDSAYVSYNSTRVDCGAALSLDQTAASVPVFHYPDADPDALYTLILIDITGIDPIVGTVPPFLPFPVIHYGAVNIPGDVLVEGVSMDKFHYDSSGLRVRPFVSYQPPKPSDDLSKIQPDYTPPDIMTRAFNHEFILGKQSSKKDDPEMDKYKNWEFIGFLKRTIVGGSPEASTYITTGYCVKEVEDVEGAIGSDCPVPAQTGSGLGSVPSHVADSSGYAGSGGGTSNESSSGSGSGGGTSNGSSSGSGSGGSTSNGSSSGSTETPGSGSDGSVDSEGNANTSNGAFVYRMGSASAISWVVGLMYGIVDA